MTFPETWTSWLFFRDSSSVGDEIGKGFCKKSMEERVKRRRIARMRKNRGVIFIIIYGKGLN